LALLPDDTKQQVQEVTGIDSTAPTPTFGGGNGGGSNSGDDSNSGGGTTTINDYTAVQFFSTEPCCKRIDGLCGI
jgi:hypothetical protein